MSFLQKLNVLIVKIEGLTPQRLEHMSSDGYNTLECLRKLNIAGKLFVGLAGWGNCRPIIGIFKSRAGNHQMFRA